MRNHLAFEVMNDDMLHLMMVGTLLSQHLITSLEKKEGVINNSLSLKYYKRLTLFTSNTKMPYSAVLEPNGPCTLQL